MNLATAPIVLQSGVIPYRYHRGEITVLLITSTSKRRWLVPKGHREPFLKPEVSAAREAWEEAGIAGYIDPHSLGTWIYDRKGTTRHVELFPLEVENFFRAWPESRRRHREWMTVAKAEATVFHAGLSELIAALPEVLESRAAITRLSGV